MANSFIQNFLNAENDAIAFSDFMYKPAGALVERRLAPDMNTLNYYLEYLEGLKKVYSQELGYVDVNGDKTKTVNQAVLDAINAAGVENGLADTLVVATAKNGGVARTQAEKNSDVTAVEDRGAIGNGVFNDGTAFNDAISLTDGGAIQLNGTKKYNLPTRIISRGKSVHIEGNGAELVLPSSTTPVYIEAGDPVVILRTSATYNKGEDFFSIIADAATANIEAGDTIVIKSSQQFALGREAYRVGTTFAVKKVTADKIYFSGSLPISLTTNKFSSEGFGLYIYKRISVIIKNVKLNRSPLLDNTTSSLQIVNAGYVELSNIQEIYGSSGITVTDSAMINIDGVGTFNHPRNTGLNYGVVLNACGYSSVKNSLITSSSTGMATGGNGFCYSSSYDNCYFGSEEHYGFSGHDNTFISNVKNSTMHGLKLAGHVTLENCDIGQNSFTSTVGFRIILSYDPLLNSVNFDNCRFWGNPMIELHNYEIEDAGVTRNKHGGISFRNCKGSATLDLYYPTSRQLSNAIVERVTIDNSPEVDAILDCNIKILTVNSAVFTSAIGVRQTPDAVSSITNVVLRDSNYTSLNQVRFFRYSSLVADNLCINPETASGGYFQLEGTGRASILNSNMRDTQYRNFTSLASLTVNNVDGLIFPNAAINLVTKLRGDNFNKHIDATATPAAGIIKVSKYSASPKSVSAMSFTSGAFYAGHTLESGFVNLKFVNGAGTAITTPVNYHADIIY